MTPHAKNNGPGDMSGARRWIMAVRPRTLPTAVAPVVVGTAAAADGRFHALPALAALAGALLLQIGVNLANDYFDFVKGVDTAERVGPVRVTQSGLIPASRVRMAMVASLAAAVLVGVYLITVGGLPILVVGTAAVAAALAYSGGPFPLASHALGDFFVFIFYGPVAVGGTYYVQALDWTHRVGLLAAMMGLLITAVLVVNNLRDIATDRNAGKLTLAVLLGPDGTRMEYRLLICGAYGLSVVGWAVGWLSPWGLLPAAALPMALRLFCVVQAKTPPPSLNQALAATAAHALIFAALLAVGVLMS